MICFDFVTNQTDRHDKNYGVILAEQDGKTQVSFAPLFDSDYVFHDESYPDKEDIAFNMGERVDRNALMKLVAEKYPEDVRNFQETLKGNESQIYQIIMENFSDKKIDGIFTGEKGTTPKSIIDVYLDVVKGNISKFNELMLQQSKETQYVDDKNSINSEEPQFTITKKDIIPLAKQKDIVDEKENALEARKGLEREQEIEAQIKD